LTFEVETNIEKLKRCKLSGISQIMAELIQVEGNILLSEIHKLINSVWKWSEVLLTYVK